MTIDLDRAIEVCEAYFEQRDPARSKAETFEENLDAINAFYDVSRECLLPLLRIHKRAREILEPIMRTCDFYSVKSVLNDAECAELRELLGINQEGSDG